jgi:hypothetical protein
MSRAAAVLRRDAANSRPSPSLEYAPNTALSIGVPRRWMSRAAAVLRRVAGNSPPLPSLASALRCSDHKKAGEEVVRSEWRL